MFRFFELRKWLLLAITVIISISVITIMSPWRNIAYVAHASPSPLQSEIDQLAVNAAARAGDRTPTEVTWVATNRGAAWSKFGFTAAGSSSDPVYVLSILGTFSYSGGMRGNHRPKTWNAIVLIVDKTTGDSTDSGIMEHPPDLSSFGATETDSLAGISPTVNIFP
ncbi:MAG: hypothetical protein HKL80_02370 [Acidimicrobiales bacterium]|nr:hypothetical protein [Acidimicrobiales bacterium]